MSFLLDAQNIQRKMSESFDQYQKQHSQHLQCQKGCSQCCHKKFSVFLWEAYVIVEYFKSISASEKIELLQKINLKDETKCSFLSDGVCSVYSARPTICRTQGAAFFLQGVMDVCPLNFEGITLNKNDCLDLDRINYIMSAMQVKFESEVKDFANDQTIDQSTDQRIELTELARLLFKIQQES